VELKMVKKGSEIMRKEGKMTASSGITTRNGGQTGYKS
jgi:hypothetical protein